MQISKSQHNKKISHLFASVRSYNFKLIINVFGASKGKKKGMTPSVGIPKVLGIIHPG